MKKSLIALAALAAAGVASAQSSVTLFGILDAGISHYSNKSGNAATLSRTAMTNSSESSSRLGFRGTEDLGGGMSAQFWLEAGLSNDDGSAGGGISAPGASSGPVSLFNRRSTVSLAGGFGEVRLGRDYTPTFGSDSAFDPYGFVGVGYNLIGKANTNSAYNPASGIYVRSSNAISYFLPRDLGGVYGQLMYAFGEADQVSGAATNNGGRHIGGRVGWANGPINVAGAYSETMSVNAVPANQVKTKIGNLGASYDFGVAKVMAEYGESRVNPESAAAGSSRRMKGWLLAATAPVGAGLLKLSYGDVRYTWNDGRVNQPKASQWALGYVHGLSKRTALYATVSRISNKNGAALSVTPGAGTALGFSGTPSTSMGYDLGLRHSF
jgi:predicted porin